MKSSFNTMENDMMKQMVLIGEIRFGDGKACVHQADFAQALEAERLTQWPKNFEDVGFVVGRLLANRKPAMLHRAEKSGIEPVTVDSLLTPEVRQRLIALLKAKATLAPYEKVALEHLESVTEAPPKALDTQVLADVFPTPPKRGRKKAKVA
jgi:hypothetical protein